MALKRKPGVAKLKKKADAIHSKYIRLRDSDSKGYGECITCDVKKHWKDAQCGHFVKRSVSLLRYDEENTNLQCLTAESNLRMFNGKNKSIAKIKVGDELWAFNEHDFNLREKAIVEATRSFVPDKLYEVEMEDGSKFYATGDHRVVANGGWIYIDEMLHNVSTYNILEL